MLIRTLDPVADLDAVEGLYARAADYWILADRRAPACPVTRPRAATRWGRPRATRTHGAQPRARCAR